MNNKFNRIKSLGYIPSDFCMSKNDIINSNHDDRFDYLLEHIYHIDTQYREDCIRVQGFITIGDFYTGLEELGKSYDFYLSYVKGYIKITFTLTLSKPFHYSSF
jgi:hypothetical protein